MQARYINELTEGSRVDATLLLRSKEVRAARTGEAFLAVELADKTGSIGGVQFRPPRVALDVPVGSVVSVQGVLTTYRGARRVSLERLRAAESWDPSDLIASSPRTADEMAAEFTSLVRSVSDQRLRLLLRAIFGDKELFARFSRCPGGQSLHHAYLGGLIEHTNAVAAMCARIAGSYEGVDRDLLVTAALLHDIGKIDELSWDTAIEYTDEGRLLGHVSLGVRRIHEQAVRVALADGVRQRLEHAVLSHHGELEWGSPKRPSTIEALLVHHVDNLDAKAAGFMQALSGASRAEEAWTDAGNLFRRPLYAPRALEDDRPVEPAEDAQHFRLTA